MKFLFLSILLAIVTVNFCGCRNVAEPAANSADGVATTKPQLLISGNSFLNAHGVTAGRDLKREMLSLDYVDFERTCRNVWNMPLTYKSTPPDGFGVKHSFIIIPECNVFYNIENGRYTFADGGAAVMKIGSGDNQSFSNEAECLIFLVSIHLDDDESTTNISPALKFKIAIDSAGGKATYSELQIINPDDGQLDFGKERNVQLIFPLAFTPCEKLSSPGDKQLTPAFNLDYSVRRYRKPWLFPVRARQFSNHLTPQGDGRIAIRSDFADTNLVLPEGEVPQQHTVN
ncbi:MAG: hypothetical protein RRY34_09135, partial [Victivallaceae bacterium]